MAKVIKGRAGRKTREPSADHSDIDDWCRHLMPDPQPIVNRSGELIRAIIPAFAQSLKGSALPFPPLAGHITALQASLDVADRQFAPPRFRPGISADPRGGFATGNLDGSPGPSRTG